MAAGRTGFAVLNHAINPLVRWLMRSPLHWLASRRVALISYTGRRSGRRYTIPVGYQMVGLQVTITGGSPERKAWWRSPTGTGAPVELIVRGRRRTGHAVATPSRRQGAFASRSIDDGQGPRDALPPASYRLSREGGGARRRLSAARVTARPAA